MVKERLRKMKIEKKKMIGKEKQKKTRDLETDYLLEDKTKLNRSKTYKDGPSKGSCDVPRQNSPGSRTEKPA